MKLPAPVIALLLTFILTVAGGGCGPVAEEPAVDESGGDRSATPDETGPSAEARQRLTMAAESRDLVLQEMRHMLEAVDGILDGVAADDMEAVAAAARRGGTEYAVDLDPVVAERLPREFKELGMRTHRGFDDLAARARQGATDERIIADLGSLTGNCVGCHVAYRLDEIRPDDDPTGAAR